MAQGAEPAVFSGLEKKLARRVKVYPVNTPAFLCVTPGNESHASYVMTERVCLPDAPFEAQVAAAVERLDELCRDGVAVFYQLLAPVGSLDHGGMPNRTYLGVRMRVLAAGCSPV